jgi:hypothetical protein
MYNILTKAEAELEAFKMQPAFTKIDGSDVLQFLQSSSYADEIHSYQPTSNHTDPYNNISAQVKDGMEIVEYLKLNTYVKDIYGDGVVQAIAEFNAARQQNDATILAKAVDRLRLYSRQLSK